MRWSGRVIDEALSAGAVARRLGVAVTTLRTWHQRYGLGPSRHIPGQHRRYTAEDMDRLELMLRLTAQGVSPAEAAAWARRGGHGAFSPGATGTSPSPAGAGRSLSPAGAGTSPPPAGEAGASPQPVGRSADWSWPGAGGARGGAGGARDGAGGARDGAGGARDGGSGVRDGGGQAIAVGNAGPAARGLARAAMRLDATAMRDILEEAVASRGVVAAWLDVAMPVLIGIGDRFQATQRFVEVEHLLSRSVTEVLAAVSRPSRIGPSRVLLAAADEEQHTLALEALAAALAEAAVPARLLGGRVPPRALADAIARTGPAVVVLWSQTPDTGDPDQLARIAGPPRPPLLVAAVGPGWPQVLPPGVARPSTLPDAVDLVRSAVA